ncbi:hypothetical protein [Sagittula sp. SSi028]|uniref:hypothetical protein n=1 Tax=Sagittula sp. SSi028 TaxID=3400636 RepID=UPI003AF6F91D
MPDLAPHWSTAFPQLCETDPRLDILRYELMYAEAEHPLQGLRETLGAALGKAVEIRLPAEPERSFDERWLLALFDAASKADLSGYQFLLRSRMQAQDAAQVHFALTQAQVWLEARL